MNRFSQCRVVVILSFIFTLFLTNCSSKEEEKVSEYEELVYTGEEFLQNMFTKNFKRAESFCDNASKNSVRKLANFKYDFRNVYFKKIDTCIIAKNTAECVCVYEDYSSNEFKQTLVLKKYKKEWLVHFILDENFDNIFLYDYSSKPFKGEGKWNHLNFKPASNEYVLKLLKMINSNQLVMGHTDINQIEQIDENVKDSDNYFVDSEVVLDSLRFVRNYNLDYGTLETFVCKVNILSEEDLQFYYKSLVSSCVDEFGEPFNIKAADNQYGYHNFHALRWFIKGYNEVVELNYSPGVFTITLKSVI